METALTIIGLVYVLGLIASAIDAHGWSVLKWPINVPVNLTRGWWKKRDLRRNPGKYLSVWDADGIRPADHEDLYRFGLTDEPPARVGAATEEDHDG